MPKYTKHRATELKEKQTILLQLETSIKKDLEIDSKEIQDLNNTINQLDQTGIYGRLTLTAAKYTVLSSAHGILSRTNHIFRTPHKFQYFKISKSYKYVVE